MQAIQGKATVSLTSNEKAAVAMYAIGAGSGGGVAAQSDSDDDGEPNFIEQGKSEYDSKRPKQQPAYKSTLHISPTSNIVERLFSRCGLMAYYASASPPNGSKHARDACHASLQQRSLGRKGR